MLRQALLLAHLLSAIAWLGGMFFAYTCLRPAAAEVLEPPQRLPLWVATFQRFLPFMAVAVVILLATGLAMLLQVGLRGSPLGWHIMLALGLLMAAVFAVVYAHHFPRLRAQSASATWPAAAKTLNQIRRLVGLNIVLGILTVVAAVSAR